MDGQALVIEIGRRAKAKARAESGAAPDAEEGDDEAKDFDAVKESAAKDVALALGLELDQVDLPALASALCDLFEAESLGAGKKKKASAE